VPRLVHLPSQHEPGDKAAALDLALRPDPAYTGVFFRICKPILDSRLRRLHAETLKRYSSGTRSPSIRSLVERSL